MLVQSLWHTGVAAEKERTTGELPRERGMEEGLQCLGDVSQRHGKESLGQRPPRAVASWRLVTTKLYLIYGQQMWGEISSVMQTRQARKG